MRLNITWESDTSVILDAKADASELQSIKTRVLKELSAKVKVAGFRAGHVPLEVVEKNISSNELQQAFLDEALNTLYGAALRQERLRPAGRPEVSIKAFVPYMQLDVELKVPVIGKVVLGDYKKLKAKLVPAKVVEADVKTVLDNLATRMAEKKDVERASKNTDQLWIDFAGKDQKGKAIERADGKDYPLVLGSNTFIPGFEENLVGFKAGDKTSFTVTFPKDYGQKDLQSKKVTFDVTVNKVQEVTTPKHDDEFAKKLGPFKDMTQLKDDIKKQLQAEKDEASKRDYEAEAVREITGKSKVAIPENLITEQADAMIAEFKRDLVARGQTWQEFLDGNKTTEEKYRSETINPAAEERIKAGLVLSAIAEQEKLTVEEAELDARITQLKTQYNDELMQKELDKPENQQDIAARILSEKTIQFLTK